MNDNLYDHPRLYEAAFGWDPAPEIEFYGACLAAHGTGKVKRILETGCGTGRILLGLAEKGYEAVGVDLNQTMVEYAAEKARERGLKMELYTADMAEFTLERPCDGAFCAISTFRYLLTDEQIKGHLECMAAALRPGAVYAIDLELLGDPEKFEVGLQDEWELVHEEPEKIEVKSEFSYLTPPNLERMRILAEGHIFYKSDEEEYEFMQWEAMRVWPLAELRRFIDDTPFSIVKWYEPKGVWDVDQEFEPDEESERVVVVLKRD